MVRKPAHPWAFRARFRRRAFGWRPQPAVQRVQEAVREIQQVARTEAVVAAEGAVLFLEKVSPALEEVDSSSGAIGAAVHHAIDELAPIIVGCPADAATREGWLERLYRAYLDDGIPYIEHLAEHWGELCASPERASSWADDLVDGVRAAWGPGRRGSSHFKGATICLSALLAAGRHDELLELLALPGGRLWHYQKFGVESLAAQGRRAEAIRYAEASRGPYDNPIAIARACERLLLDSGLADEAYVRYGLVAHQAGTYLAWFRAVARAYPSKAKAQILADLAALTPGEEGKWFAAAKSAGLLDEAIALANRSPCDPRTLTRAARDFRAKQPGFAVEAGLAALRWLLEGYGYEITTSDVAEAWDHTLEAAEHAGTADEVCRRLRAMVEAQSAGASRVAEIVRRRLERRPG